jgi:alpha-ribazole phosphatase/probable phosphoglycerate mutase
MYTKTIYLIRHGTTEWIEQGRTHGALDSPLSTFGQWEAQQAAEALKDCDITHIFSSPQGRAMQTAAFIAREIPKAEVIPLDGLREMGFGLIEGKPDQFRKISKNPLCYFLFAPFWFILLGLTGENRAELQKRVLDAWQFILTQKNSGNAVVVSHAIALNVILHTLPCGSGITKKKRYSLGTCSISKVELDEQGRCFLTQINDISHLENTGNYEH